MGKEESLGNATETTKPQSTPADGFFPNEGEIHTAHWHVLVPTLVIGVLYLLGFFWLTMVGKGDSALARLFTIVLSIGVPLLAAHALLRFTTSRIQFSGDHIRYQKGWPMRLPVDMPYALIAGCKVKRGLSGRLFGGGTVVLNLTTGEKIAVPDLKDPEGVKTRLESALLDYDQSDETEADSVSDSASAGSDNSSASTI